MTCVFSALPEFVACLDRNNNCSREETRRTVLDFYSFVYTYNRQFNEALDDEVNFDNVPFIFTCQPREGQLLDSYTQQSASYAMEK